MTRNRIEFVDVTEIGDSIASYAISLVRHYDDEQNFDLMFRSKYAPPERLFDNKSTQFFTASAPGGSSVIVYTSGCPVTKDD
jgi:hypothetical protein